jgi:hypothetical protein
LVEIKARGKFNHRHMVDIPRIKFFAQRRYRANWSFLDGHEIGKRQKILWNNARMGSSQNIDDRIQLDIGTACARRHRAGKLLKGCNGNPYNSVLLHLRSRKGSRINKYAFLGVETPAWQGAEAPRKHNGIFDRNIEIFLCFGNTARQDASAHKNVKLFLREP